VSLSPDEEDIPYGDDWHSDGGVAAWAAAADRKRPWRSQFQDRFAEEIAKLPQGASVLELGSGPGFLAERILERCGQLSRYTLLDFSEPMLALSRQRLKRFTTAFYVCASYKSEEWPTQVQGRYDCVVSMQAIHELRHKRHAQRLYQQLHTVLATSAVVLICDHTPEAFEPTPRNLALYMTEQEQLAALTAAGFQPRILLSLNGLVLYRGDTNR
jgi:ubiquinone/menaquinone biosynthesis C-methylase UbiE